MADVGFDPSTLGAVRLISWRISPPDHGASLLNYNYKFAQKRFHCSIVPFTSWNQAEPFLSNLMPNIKNKKSKILSRKHSWACGMSSGTVQGTRNKDSLLARFYNFSHRTPKPSPSLWNNSHAQSEVSNNPVKNRLNLKPLSLLLVLKGASRSICKLSVWAMYSGHPIFVLIYLDRY